MRVNWRWITSVSLAIKNIKMILQSNQDLKDKNDNVQSECDMHAFVRGKDYYGGKNNG